MSSRNRANRCPSPCRSEPPRAQPRRAACHRTCPAWSSHRLRTLARPVDAPEAQKRTPAENRLSNFRTPYADPGRSSSGFAGSWDPGRRETAAGRHALDTVNTRPPRRRPCSRRSTGSTSVLHGVCAATGLTLSTCPSPQPAGCCSRSRAGRRIGAARWHGVFGALTILAQSTPACTGGVRRVRREARTGGNRSEAAGNPLALKLPVRRMRILLANG